MKCETCNGTGKIPVLQNYEAHYDGWDEPIVENEPCEDCGGTGEKEN